MTLTTTGMKNNNDVSYFWGGNGIRIVQSYFIVSVIISTVGIVIFGMTLTAVIIAKRSCQEKGIFTKFTLGIVMFVVAQSMFETLIYGICWHKGLRLLRRNGPLRRVAALRRHHTKEFDCKHWSVEAMRYTMNMGQCVEEKCRRREMCNSTIDWYRARSADKSAEEHVGSDDDEYSDEIRRGSNENITDDFRRKRNDMHRAIKSVGRLAASTEHKWELPSQPRENKIHDEAFSQCVRNAFQGIDCVSLLTIIFWLIIAFNSDYGPNDKLTSPEHIKAASRTCLFIYSFNWCVVALVTVQAVVRVVPTILNIIYMMENDEDINKQRHSTSTESL